MRKDELKELAVEGMRMRLLQTEKNLANWHKEFPELFTGAPPTFVKMENGNNGWPQLEVKKKSGKPSKRGHNSAIARRPTTGFMWEKAIAYLTKHGPTSSSALAKALHLPGDSNMAARLATQLKKEWVIRPEPGIYAVGPKQPAE